MISTLIDLTQVSLLSQIGGETGVFSPFVDTTDLTDIFNLLFYGFVFVAFAAGMSKGGQR
jgi:hypothetical protein